MQRPDFLVINHFPFYSHNISHIVDRAHTPQHAWLIARRLSRDIDEGYVDVWKLNAKGHAERVDCPFPWFSREELSDIF